MSDTNTVLSHEQINDNGTKRFSLRSLNENFLIALFCLDIIIIFVQIVVRTVYRPLPWPGEISRYLFLYLVFAGAGLALDRGVFISVDLLSSLISGKAKRINLFLEAVVYTLSVVFLIVLVYGGTKLFFSPGRQLTPATRFPIRYVYLAIPVFGLQTAYYCFKATVCAVRSLIQENRKR